MHFPLILLFNNFSFFFLSFSLCSYMCFSSQSIWMQLTSALGNLYNFTYINRIWWSGVKNKKARNYSSIWCSSVRSFGSICICVSIYTRSCIVPGIHLTNTHTIPYHFPYTKSLWYLTHTTEIWIYDNRFIVYIFHYSNPLPFHFYLWNGTNYSPVLYAPPFSVIRRHHNHHQQHPVSSQRVRRRYSEHRLHAAFVSHESVYLQLCHGSKCMHSESLTLFPFYSTLSLMCAVLVSSSCFVWVTSFKDQTNLAVETFLFFREFILLFLFMQLYYFQFCRQMCPWLTVNKK